MADRKLVVMNGGLLQQLQSGDDPVAPTQSAGDNSTKVATTAYADAAAAARAPADADYLVKTAHDGLSAERVVTDTSVIDWDWTSPGLAKARIGGSATLYGAFDALSYPQTVASASTVNLQGSAVGVSVRITGTTTITSFGTGADGIFRMLSFAGALILTHNATSLILPTGANITTAAGDAAIFQSLGSGNWRCLSYQRADGTPLVKGNRVTAVTETAKSATFTADWGNHYACTGTTYTINLTTASGNAGKVMSIRCASSGTLTLDGNSSETVGGRTTLALIPGDYIELQSDGTNVKILSFTHADWTTFTPTINATTTNPTKGATRSEMCTWKRDGRDMLINFHYRQNSAGTAGSGTYLFLIPGSYSIDTALFEVGTFGSASLIGSLAGTGTSQVYSGGWYSCVFGVTAYDSTNLILHGIYDGGGTPYFLIGSSAFQMSVGDVIYHFTARFPISGW